MAVRPCSLKHPTPVPGECSICRKYVTDSRYRALWSDEQQMCKYLGDATGETKLVKCTTGIKPIPTYFCSKFEVCTLGRPINGVACCNGCSYFEV